MYYHLNKKSAVKQSIKLFILSKTDIIIEVAHPIISENFGVKFLQNGSDYMVVK